MRNYDTDYADNQALLVNTPVQAKFLLHSLEQASRGIGLNINANKTEFMTLKQRGGGGGISTKWQASKIRRMGRERERERTHMIGQYGVGFRNFLSGDTNQRLKRGRNACSVKKKHH